MNRIILIFSMILILSGCGSKENHDDHAEHAGKEKETVHLSQESQRLIGLEVVVAERRPLQTTIEVTGEIAQETEQVIHVTSPEAGRLKAFRVGLGEVVEEGMPVCLVETRAGAALEIKSPGHGIMLAQYVKEGDSVDTLTSILTIADPDVLRVSFNIYEKDLAGIKIGQKIQVYSVAYPEKAFDGEIVFISPRVDEKTRTIKIRVDVKNEEHLLKFGMFVTGKILVPLSEEALVVPDRAVQMIDGKAVVFIPEKGDEFLVREIKPGRRSGEWIEVLEGVAAGEPVVGKGSFYVKSEHLKGELAEGHAH